VDINTNNPGGSGTRLTVGGDIEIQRITINDAVGNYLKVLKSRNGTDGQDNDVIGGIQFDSYDDGTPTKVTYGQIIGRIGDASSGSPKGEIGMLLQTTTGLYETLTLKRSTGQSTEGAVIDVIETYTNITNHNSLQLTPSNHNAFIDGGVHIGGVYGDTAPGDNNLIVAGNASIGADPQTYDSGYRVCQFGKYGTIYCSNSSVITCLTNNVYGAVDTYIKSSYSQKIQLDTYGIKLCTSAGGTAGNPITWIDALSVASTTGAVGIAQAPGTEKLEVTGKIKATDIIYAESTKRVACGGGTTGATTAAIGVVTLQIGSNIYELLYTSVTPV
jgi:hypothetical protein